MKHHIFSTVTSYTHWIISNYQAIAKINSTTPQLKFISLEHDAKSNEYFFIIQVSGKNLFPRLPVQTFVNDSSLLVNFNESDQEKIQQLLLKHTKYFSARIVTRNYDRTIKQLLFTIEYQTQNKNIKKSLPLDKLSLLIKDIHLFDAEDAFLIGFYSSLNS